MKFLYTPCVLVFVFITNINAQNAKTGRLAQWLSTQQAQSAQRAGQALNLFALENDKIAEKAVLQKTISDFALLSLDANALQRALQTAESLVELVVPIENGKTVTLSLAKAEPTATDFKVNSPQGYLPYQQGVHYRGIIKGDPSSVAAISLFDGEAMGVFSNENGNYTLGKLEDKSGNYIVYADKYLRQANNFECHTTNENEHAKSGLPMPANPLVNIGDVCKVVRLYWEADYGLFVNKGSAVNTVNYLTAVFNQMAALYQNDGILVQLSETFVWTTADPYRFDTSGNALVDFRSRHRALNNAFNGDLAHLVAYDNDGNGGVAYLNVLCSRTNAYGYSDIYTNFSNIPTYSWTIEVLAHEIGHNLGSEHTHDCVWNGNATRIDDCGATAGYATGTCGNVGTPVKGTIMSYCHLVGGIGINLALGFGVQPSDLIKTKITAAACLQPAIATTNTFTNLCAPNTGSIDLTVSGLGTPGYTYVWSPGGATTQDLNAVSANAYTVLITDANACTRIASVTLVNLSLSGSATPSTLAKNCGTGAVDMAFVTTGRSNLTTNQVSAWWITSDNPISNSVTTQTTLDAAIAAAALNPASVLPSNTSFIYEADNITALTKSFVCGTNLNPNKTYYATPLIATKRALLADINLIHNGVTYSNGTFNTKNARYYSSGVISGRPASPPNPPTFTITIDITAIAGSPSGAITDLAFYFYNSGQPNTLKGWAEKASGTGTGGVGTYVFNSAQLPGFTPDNPISFFMFDWVVGMTATFTTRIDINYPGLPAIPFPTVKYENCLFGTPYTFNCATAAATAVSLTNAPVSNLVEGCTEADGFTYYTTSADRSKSVFAINWNPTNIVGAHNAAARAIANVSVGYDASPASATNGMIGAANETTWAMRRYWNVDLGATLLDGPVNVRFFYDKTAEKDAITGVGSPQAAAIAAGANNQGFSWFKTVGQAFAPSLVNQYGIGTNGNTIALIDANVSDTKNGILYAQFNGVTSFSGGTGASGVGGGASPLPISLLYFTGAVKGKNVELEWQTSSELNNDFFTLERSADGKTFEPIAQIRGAGTTTQTQKYTFTDVQPLPNTSYYRLTQTDFDGKTAQHNTVNVQFKTTKLFEISPNPIRDVLFVSFSNINPTETATLEVLNMLGQLVYTEQIPENTVQRKIDASAFAAGAYAIRLRQAEKAYTTIFIK